MSELDDYFKKGTGSKIPAKGQQFSGVMSREEQKIAGQAKINNNFERGLVSKTRKGDMQAAALLGAIQNGQVDVSGPTGVRDANPRQDLNVGQNRVDQKNQEMWADQGAGEIPEPNQAPKAAEPHRGNGQPSDGTTLQGRDAKDQPLQNAGTSGTRAELGNGAGNIPENAKTSSSGGEWVNVGPSATRPAATSPARQETSGNVIPAKTNYAKVAQDAFKSDLEKSNLIKTGRDYEAGKAPEEVRAAQEMALKRGESLGGNREQLQEMIGMETDSAVKARKGQEYQDKFGDSDQKYKELLGRSLTENGKPLTGEKATAEINKMFDATTPQDRLDSISKLSDGPSDKTKALLLEAKQKAAARMGYTGEVTADTDFGAEAKSLIPGAKIGAKALIDARELLPGKEGDSVFQAETDDLKRLRGLPVASFDETGSANANKFFELSGRKEEKQKEDPFTFDNLLGDGSSYKAPESKHSDKPSDGSESGNELDWNVDFKTIAGNPSDPRHKALFIKNKAYSNAWWQTPNTPIGQGDVKHFEVRKEERGRANMIEMAIEKGVDISGITKQDPLLHKQYEQAKEQKQQSEKTREVTTQSAAVNQKIQTNRNWFLGEEEETALT